MVHDVREEKLICSTKTFGASIFEVDIEKLGSFLMTTLNKHQKGTSPFLSFILTL